MVDEDGRPVHSQAALAARDALVEQLCALPAIATALDAIIERFGTSPRRRGDRAHPPARLGHEWRPAPGTPNAQVEPG